MNIDLNQRIALLRLALDTYHTQAQLCNGAGASLAACIMAGASVEAVLTAVTSFLYEDALKTGKTPRYNRGKRIGETLDLLEWSFYQLLDVATEAKWLPGTLILDKNLMVGCTFD